MQPIKILFVCLGNICRSPMAEYVMREKIKQAHLQHKILTASAGTSGWHDGEGMHCGTADILDQHKIASNDFVSRKVRSKDWADFDYLIAMDNEIYGIWKRYLDIIRKNCFKSPHFAQI